MVMDMSYFAKKMGGGDSNTFDDSYYSIELS